MRVFVLLIAAGLLVAAPARDGKTALAQWRKLAEAGSAEGQRMVGWAYEKGKGVPRDAEQAAIWYKRAAANGNSKAKAALEAMEEREAYRQKQVHTPAQLCPWVGGTPYCRPLP